ncbi:MAG: CbiX/SirB N-terminal domain-containing protein [Thermoleophilia bacterium]
MASARLVLYAHGSPDPRWRAPFERLAGAVAADVGADAVRLAYMESAAPTLAEVGDEAARDGVTALRVLPLFLASGVHVRRDVEAKAAAIREAHPGLAVELLPPAGEDALVQDALRAVAVRSLLGA